MASECVKVMVRCRPMNSKEDARQCGQVVHVYKKQKQIVMRDVGAQEGSADERQFTYDEVYGMDSTQRQVYDETAFPLVESTLAGYNGTIFAYGQTGCGKTHTMTGLPGAEMRGIIPNAFEHIYGFLDDSANSNKKFLVRASFLEIYNEEIRDLLGKDTNKKLDLRQDTNKGVYVADLTILTVKSVSEIESLMDVGNKSRHVGATAMNDTSSRSHSLFTIYIEQAETVEGKQRFKAGKLNLVDLAGSERQSKTQATGVRLKEATKINLSLSALGNVISSLVDGRSQHIPYRDSKLTRLLQDSLGGNTKTCMIAAISPADYSAEETISTLRYASRAKSIKNKPRVNEDPKDALLKQYEEEIQRLKQMLEKNAQANSAAPASSEATAAGTELAANLERALSHGALDFLDGSPPVKKRDTMKEETVESLLEKLASKGENVKIVSTEEDAQNAQKQKQQAAEMNNMQAIIQQMESQLVSGGNALEEKEKKLAQEKRKMQMELDEERQKQQKILDEKMAQEEMMMEVEQKYGSLQEEVTEQRKIIKRLRQKKKQAEAELKDIQRNENDDREELLLVIREQEKDLDFLNGVVSMMLKDTEMYKLKEKIKFDFEKGKWIVPPFVVKQKEVAFPKIGMAKNFVREEKNQREIIIADTGEVVSGDSESSFKGSRMNDSRAMTGQFGGEQITDKFQKNSAKNSRNAMYQQQYDGSDSMNEGDMQSPFSGPGTNNKQGLRDRFAAQNNGSNLDMPPYYSDAKGGSASSSQRQIAMQEKYGQSKYKEKGSSLNMIRNDSDLSATGINGNAQGLKYNSLDRGSGVIGESQEMSPPERRKKANVHLQPMDHKQAAILQPHPGLQPLASSESNPILNAPAVMNDRVKLDKLNHIPSVKSNLMSQENNNSQVDLNAKPALNNGPSFNYENMPVGKSKMLAPLQNVSPLIGSSKQEQVIQNMQHPDIANRKNNRALKPLKSFKK